MDVNGETGEFSQNYKGFELGTYYLYCFLIWSDTLSAMLNLACMQGELEGLVPHLVENGLSHL